jgi:hypothetical protein
MGSKPKGENMEHTKGPWIVSSSTIVCDESARIISQGVCFDGLGVPIGEAMANALLISAAPDLLEACKRAEVELGFMEGMTKQKASQDVFNSLQAAIAKAEGR